MHRTDDSKFLLYIEPKRAERTSNPINDEWTELFEALLKTAKTGAAHYSNLELMEPDFVENSCWRGIHTADDGEISGNREFLLPGGYVTNSLCVYYLRYYRNSIPESEWRKLKRIKEIVTSADYNEYLQTVTHNQEP